MQQGPAWSEMSLAAHCSCCWRTDSVGYLHQKQSQLCFMAIHAVLVVKCAMQQQSAHDFQWAKSQHMSQCVEKHSANRTTRQQILLSHANCWTAG